MDNLEEERDSVTLRCLANSNPPPKVWWQKEGINGIFNPDGEIVISPITRNSAGTYKCMAENALGLSEPTYVEINVKCKKTIDLKIIIGVVTTLGGGSRICDDSTKAKNVTIGGESVKNSSKFCNVINEQPLYSLFSLVWIRRCDKSSNQKKN